MQRPKTPQGPKTRQIVCRTRQVRNGIKPAAVEKGNATSILKHPLAWAEIALDPELYTLKGRQCANRLGPFRGTICFINQSIAIVL